MKTRAPSCRPLLSLKLDITKAYDQVEWVFLNVLCYKLGLLQLGIHGYEVCMYCLLLSFD